MYQSLLDTAGMSQQLLPSKLLPSLIPSRALVQPLRNTHVRTRCKLLHTQQNTRRGSTRTSRHITS